MTKVIIRTNSIDDYHDSVFDDVEKVGDFLRDRFDNWPDTAVLYQDEVSVASEIPINNADDIRRLNKLNGTVYVVIYPANFLAVIGIALIAATVAIQMYVNRDKSASAQQQRDIPQGSPNNQLSTRSNRERLEERIPDIYGKVRAFPDMLLKPYKVYRENREIEYGYFCIGRGQYEVTEIQDGETPLSSMPGNSVEVYGPDTSPNSGAVQKRIGAEITEPLVTVIESNSVKSQEFVPPNEEGYSGTLSLNSFQFGGGVDGKNFGPVFPFELNRPIAYDDQNLTEYWIDTDQLEILTNNDISLFEITGYEDRPFIGGRKAVTEFVETLGNLSGTYEISSVATDKIILDNPGAINSVWDDIKFYIDTDQIGVEKYDDTENATLEAENIGKYIIGSTISFTTGSNPNKVTTGPFPLKDIDSFICNFVADRGLWHDDGTTQTALTVNFDVTIEELDTNGSATGTEVTDLVSITGSATERKRIAETRQFDLPSVGDWQITIVRTTDSITEVSGETHEDEIKWESLYGAKEVSENHFGNITTVRTETISNEETLAIKERKLNMLVTRLIDYREADETFTPLTATSRFPDIARAICLDSKIGNRNESELDIDNFYSVYNEVITTFGTAKAGEFNHTFDKANMSLEETLAVIAEACFCTVYRQGSLIKFHFEKETALSSLLFNHRNKIPKTESRTVSFGRLNGHDGVEIQYVDITDGATLTLYLPSDQSAVNPEKLKPLGITHKLQAYFHAYRAWNRVQYQHTAVEFDATQEAALLKLNERVRIADNTRPNTFDGEVVSQNGLTLKLSQPFEFEAGKTYTIFLQNTDGTVQGIGISPGPLTDEVVLDEATTFPLALAQDLYARTTYEIIEDSSSRSQAFLIEEKAPRDNFTFSMRAVNYDSRYYQNDTDYIDGVVNDNGNII